MATSCNKSPGDDVYGQRAEEHPADPVEERGPPHGRSALLCLDPMLIGHAPRVQKEPRYQDWQTKAAQEASHQHPDPEPENPGAETGGELGEAKPPGLTRVGSVRHAVLSPGFCHRHVHLVLLPRGSGCLEPYAAETVGRNRLSRLALLITVTLLNDIANAASNGESRIPRNGYSTPNAIGSPAEL